MGIFDQMKMAQEMMKNMSPEQIREIMAMAPQLAKQMPQNLAAPDSKELEDMIRKIVSEEIEKRGLVSKSDLDRLVSKQ